MRVIVATLIFAGFFGSSFSQNLHKKDSMYTIINGEKVYKRVQFKPEFPGGKDSLLIFFDKNLNIPAGKKEGGSVTVSFIVDKLGKVSDPKILSGNSAHPEYDQEALRVIGLMPPWNPAIHLGNKVSCIFTMPISFVLDNKTSRK